MKFIDQKQLEADAKYRELLETCTICGNKELPEPVKVVEKADEVKEFYKWNIDKYWPKGLSL